MLAHLQQLLQQRALARAQKVGHVESLAVMSGGIVAAAAMTDLMAINASAPAARPRGLPRMAGHWLP